MKIVLAISIEESDVKRLKYKSIKSKMSLSEYCRRILNEGYK